MIEFTVPAIPCAQPRQRHAVRQFAGKAVAVNYTPHTSPVVAFKASVRQSFAESYSGPPLDGPVRMRVLAVFPRTRAQIWKRRPMPRMRHTKKPDRDNLDKAVLDALEGLAFVNDCQVCAGAVEKWIAAGDEQPHVEVCIEQISEGERT